MKSALQSLISLSRLLEEKRKGTGREKEKERKKEKGKEIEGRKGKKK
jgi:hypothetical protein